MIAALEPAWARATTGPSSATTREGDAVRQPDRLQLRRARPGRLRALPQRRAGRRQDRVPLDPRRASRARAGGRRRPVLARPRGAADRDRGARRARRGSVVAIVPATGEVRAMVSVPTYDPNEVAELAGVPGAQPGPGRAPVQPRHPGRLPARLDDEGRDRDRGARQRRVRPGHGPQRRLAEGDLGRAARRTPAARASATSTWTTALTNSVNTYWAQVGEELGTDTMYKYMDRFGFNEKPPLDYPSFQLATSRRVRRRQAARAGRRPDRRRPHGDRPGQAQRDPAADGEVAAAVANDGELMEPRLWSKVIDTDGREEKLDPERQSRVMSEDTADDPDRDDDRRRQRGNGRRRGAGRATRSPARREPRRSTSERDVNQAWFIGFAPADDPQIAVAATVERTTGLRR